MNLAELSKEEFRRLEKLLQESTKKLYVVPWVYFLILLGAFIPAKYLPRRLRDSGKTIDGEESLFSLMGFSNFLWFLLIWTVIMGLAALTDYRNLGIIKKDLKYKTKLKLKGKVSRVVSYNGKPFIRVKTVNGVKVLHFDESNYIDLSVDDEIEFEVYEHSEIFIKILSKMTKKPKYEPPMVHEVTDTCPACFQKLAQQDKVCPDCGLNLS